jgi:HEPN domain-containing protein
MSQETYRHDSRRWLAQARADLKAAEGSVQNESFEWAAFQAQQAGEKALKALWFLHAADPWGHSLVRLIQDFPMAAIRDRLQSLMPQAKKLDKLYVTTRYPNGLPDLIPAEVFTREEARDAIDTAKSLLDFVSPLIPR